MICDWKNPEYPNYANYVDEDGNIIECSGIVDEYYDSSGGEHLLCQNHFQYGKNRLMHDDGIPISKGYYDEVYNFGDSTLSGGEEYLKRRKEWIEKFKLDIKE